MDHFPQNVFTNLEADLCPPPCDPPPYIILPCRSVKAEVGPRSGGECVMSGETKDWHVWSLKLSTNIIIISAPQLSWVVSVISYISKP